MQRRYLGEDSFQLILYDYGAIRETQIRLAVTDGAGVTHTVSLLFPFRYQSVSGQPSPIIATTTWEEIGDWMGKESHEEDVLVPAAAYSGYSYIKWKSKRADRFVVCSPNEYVLSSGALISQYDFSTSPFAAQETSFLQFIGRHFRFLCPFLSRSAVLAPQAKRPFVAFLLSKWTRLVRNLASRWKKNYGI